MIKKVGLWGCILAGVASVYGEGGSCLDGDALVIDEGLGVYHCEHGDVSEADCLLEIGDSGLPLVTFDPVFSAWVIEPQVRTLRVMTFDEKMIPALYKAHAAMDKLFNHPLLEASVAGMQSQGITVVIGDRDECNVFNVYLKYIENVLAYLKSVHCPIVGGKDLDDDLEKALEDLCVSGEGIFDDEDVLWIESQLLDDRFTDGMLRNNDDLLLFSNLLNVQMPDYLLLVKGQCFTNDLICIDDRVLLETQILDQKADLSTLIHELGHVVHNQIVPFMAAEGPFDFEILNHPFNQRLQEAYDESVENFIKQFPSQLPEVYSEEDPYCYKDIYEFFAEGVAMYFSKVNFKDGLYFDRLSLKDFSPQLYEIIESVFGQRVDEGPML